MCSLNAKVRLFSERLFPVNQILSMLAGLSFLIANVSGTTAANARELTEEEKIADVEQFFQLVKAGYGPLGFKEASQGINQKSLRVRYLEEARQTKTNRNFYYMLGRLIAEYRDSHFSVMIPSKLRASLGFSVDLIEGRVLVDEVTSYSGRYALSKGDEIVTVDGIPATVVVEELMAYVSSGYEVTRRRAAAMALTQRNGSRMPVPRGNIALGIRKSGDAASVDTVNLAWNVTGNAFDESLTQDRRATNYLQDFQLSIVPEMKSLLFADAEQSFRCNGRTRAKIPEGAVMIQEKPFVAYYHPVDHKGRRINIGYLRIPHYHPASDNPDSSPNDPAIYDEYYARYEYSVAELEHHTDGLIIDQDHNCGGSVDYLERLVGLFMDKPYPGLRFSFLATKQELVDFSAELDGMMQQSMSYKYFKSVVDMMRNSWEKGEPMTPITTFMGDHLRRPNPEYRYSKPIVMLIDELSGSGGDAFPAILKGLGRAKLLGTRTMGAGGHVVEQTPLYHSAVGMRMTKSLFFRPDGVPVENNGAEPDFPYTPTRNDFLNGYTDYQKFYLGKLLEQIQ
jgi:hypothetical protein